MKIETLEQLEALPIGSVIHDGRQVWQKIRGGGWRSALWAETYGSKSLLQILPATLLIPAEVTDEGRCEACGRR